MRTSWTLHGSGRRRLDDGWAGLHRMAEDWTAAWSDNDGFHLEVMPERAPVTTQLWAWTTRKWLRVRLDPPHWWAAVLRYESEQDGGEDLVEESWSADDVAQPRIDRVLHWDSNDKRIQQLRSPNERPFDHEIFRLVPLRSRPTTATFIGGKDSVPQSLRK
ncbi:hypothetical protein SAMN04487819_11099 [Actinopolyspora alba]|uniref:Uncharacterized protein n=2 Tax=Actinopolyspora TaxID=1849 RepID=A0A1G9D0H0_ACTMZ|nr:MULTISPECIES: hypothetical protein [Actinopolyspora]SDK57333.1 hypothetical protein SAMN04487820_109181 [Actinopolyspora mzabensis]SFE27458.1 hypothetical protein SAMN04487819_11099 [Actinopolyspora alba]